MSEYLQGLLTKMAATKVKPLCHCLLSYMLPVHILCKNIMQQKITNHISSCQFCFKYDFYSR